MFITHSSQTGADEEKTIFKSEKILTSHGPLRELFRKFCPLDPIVIANSKIRLHVIGPLSHVVVFYVSSDPKQPITTKALRSLPVAFAMLEKTEMSNNPGSPSAHTVFGDGAFF